MQNGRRGGDFAEISLVGEADVTLNFQFARSGDDAFGEPYAIPDGAERPALLSARPPKTHPLNPRCLPATEFDFCFLDIDSGIKEFVDTEGTALDASRPHPPPPPHQPGSFRCRRDDRIPAGADAKGDHHGVRDGRVPLATAPPQPFLLPPFLPIGAEARKATSNSPSGTITMASYRTGVWSPTSSARKPRWT